MLYVSRPDWPETPVVASWMDRNATARAIPLDMLRSGGFVDQLHTLLAGPRRPPVEATGGVEAADLLDALLRQSSCGFGGGFRAVGRPDRVCERWAMRHVGKEGWSRWRT